MVPAHQLEGHCFHSCKCIARKDAFHSHSQYAQWLPPSWTFQWIFLLYRLFLAFYFSGWLLYYSIENGDQGGKFMIYLTNWGFLVWVAYLISAAAAVTVKFIRVCACDHIATFPRRRGSLLYESQEAACCSCRRTAADNINCCDKFTWFLFMIGGEGAVLIAILFWATEYNLDSSTSPTSIHVHLINAMVALIDLWVSGVPVFLLHFVYIQLFGVAYTIFTGIYSVAFENTTAIYSVLDYHSNPGQAAGLAVGTAVFGTVLIHLLFLMQYLCRRAATARLLTKYKGFSSFTDIITQNSASPSSSGASSSCSDTTILAHNNKQHSTHSSQESFF